MSPAAGSELPTVQSLGSLAARTLRIAGYTIIEFQQTQDVVEIRCSIPSRFGAVLDFAFVFTTRERFSDNEHDDFAHAAASQGRALVMVAMMSGSRQVSWNEFTRRLGGAVPSWRALEKTFRSSLLMASKNTLPEGEDGEAWFLFEELVSDGLEFVLGRRVIRRGGLRRGLRVSDMIAQLPNFELLVVDAKATGGKFDASISNLRALSEYTKDTQEAQSGNDVIGALLISSDFKQSKEALQEISLEFFSYNKVPVTFLKAELLADIVDGFRETPELRNGVRWRRLFAGGLITKEAVSPLIDKLNLLRVEAQEV